MFLGYACLQTRCSIGLITQKFLVAESNLGSETIVLTGTVHSRRHAGQANADIAPQNRPRHSPS